MGLLSSNDLGGKQHRRDGSTDTQHPSTAARDREVMRWAPPISVALTLGISVDFFYLRLLICLNLAGHLPTDEVQCRSAARPKAGLTTAGPFSGATTSSRPLPATAAVLLLLGSAALCNQCKCLESGSVTLSGASMRSSTPSRSPVLGQGSTAAAAEAARKSSWHPSRPSRHHHHQRTMLAVRRAARASARSSPPPTPRGGSGRAGPRARAALRRVASQLAIHIA